jgi:tRNA/rRNA methyltransferase
MHLTALATKHPFLLTSQVGILFGREDNGLYNSEVAKADRLLTIDSNPHVYSLNLGQAVLLVAYQLYRGRARRRAVTPVRRRASKGEQELLLEELLGALEERGHWADSSREAGQVGGVGWGGWVEGA